MPQDKHTNGLLAALTRLYRKVTGLILQQRLQATPRYTHVTGLHQTLAPLTEHLSCLSDQAETTNQNEAATTSNSATVNRPKAPPSLTNRLFKGLSSYFRRHRHHSAMQPQLATKMRDATRQHINMAITHARKGNMEGAQMQLDLANNALHMAEHYMNEDEYQAFHHELEAKLKSIGAEVGRL